MKRNTLNWRLLMAGVALVFSAQAQAGKSVDLVFVSPGCEFDGDGTATCAAAPDRVVFSGGMHVTMVETGKTVLMTNWNRVAKFETFCSGKPKLFRFEWQAAIDRPAQVLDSWIDCPDPPAFNMTYVYYLPTHNVEFLSDVGNRDISMISQSIVADRRGFSRINDQTDKIILLKGNLTGGMTPVNVGMLDGCYSIYYYADNTCPNLSGGFTCVRNYLDAPLCVGGTPGDTNPTVTVDLSIDDSPIIWP